MTNNITTDYVEWKHQLQINCIWRDWDFYFDIKEVLPFFNGYMVFSESEKDGKKLIAKSYEFNNYKELLKALEYFDDSERFLHCVLKHRTKDKYCLRYAHC